MKKTTATTPISLADVKLRPFTIGDVLIMERLGFGPFSEKQSTAPLTDALTFIYLLTIPFKDAQTLVEKSELDVHRTVITWAARISPEEIPAFMAKFNSTLKTQMGKIQQAG